MCAQLDFIVMTTMMVYIATMHFFPPFFLVQYPLSFATFGLYIVAFFLFWWHKEMYVALLP